MPALPSPERFADFLLLHPIASGGMGEVLLAIRLGDRSGRTFVVKRPLLGEKASGRAAQSIAREGEVLGAVRSPGIVALEAAGEIAGLPYIAVEHVRGAALDVLLDGQGPLPHDAARAVAKDLAAALAALHAAGWVHGDVAPSNILIDETGDLHLIDFGLATKVGARHVDVAGKPGYIAPEAVRSVEARAAEDIYGWGVVVTECALGRRLFKEDSLAQAGARGEAPPEALALASIVPDVGAALARDPAARPDAASIVARLSTLDVDRSALVDLVERSRGTLTPTIPMAIEVKAPEPPTRKGSPRVIEPTRPLAASAPKAPETPSSPDRWKPIALTLLVLVSLLVGAIGGRFSARRRDGAVSIGGALPRRAQIDLDGRPAARLDEGPASVEPGKHTVVVTLPKGERREYDFTVRPGEHVVLIPVGKGSTSVADPDSRAP